MNRKTKMELLLYAVFSVCFCVSHGSGAADQSMQTHFPSPPRLAKTPAELKSGKSGAEFRSFRKKTLREARKLLKNEPVIPDGYGSWHFYYACPKDGTRLKPAGQKEHECPKCGSTYSNERINAAYRGKVHDRVNRAAGTLGRAYSLTGDKRFARGVKRILMALAEDYSNYPERIDRWGNRGVLAPLGGRRYVQSLDEAIGVIKLCKAYDLTRNSEVWTPDQKRDVETKFFRPTANSLLKFNQGRNNHQTWYNAGLMCIGNVLADAELVEKVTNMTGGYYYQLRTSLGEKGLWYEGTMAYHRYALQGMVQIVEAAEPLGLHLADARKFRAMFTGPLLACYPNGRFPAIHDSDPMGLGAFSNLFRWAWHQWRDPIFAQAYARGDPGRLENLNNADVELRWPLKVKSVNLEKVGLVRMGKGNSVAGPSVFFDYGAHGGFHGHLDKLNVTLFANGREWLFDPGRLNYSRKEYKTWVKESVAHNTIVVGQKSQQATVGDLLWLRTEDGWTACAGETRAAYPNTVIRRYLWLSDRLLVDVTDVKSSGTKRVDWIIHLRANRVRHLSKLGKSASKSPGEKEGYQHLESNQCWDVERPTWWLFSAGKNNLKVWVNADKKQEVYTGQGIGYRVKSRQPYLMVRRKAEETRYVAVYDFSGRNDYVKNIETNQKSNPRVEIITGAGSTVLDFTSDGLEVR